MSCDNFSSFVNRQSLNRLIEKSFIMKTSEAIREAVDKYLAANKEDFTQVYPHKDKGLCATFQDIPAAYDLLQLIRQDETGSVFVPPWLIDSPVTEESQAIRFMLAEFMALYFEDLGD